MLYKMVSCTVKGCKTNRSKHGVSLHRFPKCPETRRLWLLAIGRNQEESVAGKVICSLHFEKDHFKKFKGRTYLEKGALPTINLPTSEDCEMVEGNDGNQCDEKFHEIIVINNEDYNDNEEIIRMVIANNRQQYDKNEHKEIINENVDDKNYKEIQPKTITYLQEIHNYSKNPLFEKKNKRLIEMRRKIKTQAQLINRQKKKIANLKAIIVHLTSLQKVDKQLGWKRDIEERRNSRSDTSAI